VKATRSPRILVACIGNIFLGDDGFGCEVARSLAGKKLPFDVQLIDYGIRGLDLAFALVEPYSVVILVDAIARGGTPGAVYVLQPVIDPSPPSVTPNAHSMEPQHLLAMARSVGDIRSEIYIVGCEPLDFGDELEGRMGLSSPVASAVPAAVEIILDLISRVRGAVREAPSACREVLQGEMI
jgi:hydrogenase maturation protease